LIPQNFFLLDLGVSAYLGNIYQTYMVNRKIL
jgi:hypothetical protein